MEFRQLEYFVTVAQCLHFGQAAELLHIGQPAISQQIQRLERELGVLLFDRSLRRVRLTASGELFLPYARAVLAAVDAAKNSVSNSRKFRIGTSIGLGDRLHSFAQALHNQHPDSEISFSYYSENQRIELVSTGQLDAAFVRGKKHNSNPQLHYALAWKDTLMVALRSGVLATTVSEVRLGELQDYPLRIVQRKLNPILFDTITQSCHRAGFEPILQYYSDGMTDSLVDLSFSDPSWTVLYESQARVLRPSGIVFYKVVPDIIVPTYLLFRQNHAHTDILLQACQLAHFDHP